MIGYLQQHPVLCLSTWAVLGLLAFAWYLKRQVYLHYRLEQAFAVLCGPIVWAALLYTIISARSSGKLPLPKQVPRRPETSGGKELAIRYNALEEDE